MADGNLGSLWMSLGIKETVSDGLKKVLSSLDKTDEKSAAISKEINSFIKELNSAKVSDSLLKSIGRIGELLSVSASGAENLGRVLNGLNVKEMSALGGNVNMSNLKEAHSLITKIMQAMSSRNMSNASMDKFFDLGNAQGFLTQIMTIDKNLKSLKDSSKGITDSVLKGDTGALVNKLTSLRKQFLESFNSGAWRGDNALQAQLSNATNNLIQFYDKLNASKGNQSLFDSVPKEAAKANEALKVTEEQAKKTAEAVASIGTKRKPATENQELAKEIERLTKNPASVKEGSNDIAGVKKQADDAKESVIKLRYELNEVLNAFRGAASKNLGIGEAGEKGRQYVDILNQVNKKIEEISKKEGGDKATAEIKNMLNSAQSYIDLLERIRKKYIEISDIRTTNPNVDTAKIKEALGLISHFREQLTQLESGRFLTGVDKSNVLPNYGRAWTSTVRTVDEITKGLSNTNTLSDLKNKADKANISVSALQTKISELEKLIDNGKQRGFNTDKLFDNLAALRNRKIEFDRALNEDPKRLNNDAYMTGLYSETAKDIKLATDAMEQFRQVQQKVSEQEKVLFSEYARRNAAEKQRQGERNAELKAMDAYAKRYMELVAARDKAMASMKEAPGLKNDSGLRSISNEIDTLLNRLSKVREDITLYSHAIENGTKESITFGQQGLKEANSEAERLMTTIENLQRVYDTLRNSQAHIDDLVGNTFAKKRSQDTLAKMSEFYKAEEKASAKKAAQDEAQSKRDAAKATREANAAEKQRQTELENSLRRIQSMEKTLANLQEKRFTSKMLGLDTSEAEARINLLKVHLNELYDIANRLGTKDMSAVGKLGNLGNGRETQAANDLARSYDKANKEAQRGVDIEQKRQQEIAKSAAKVQADLVRGFEKANSSAGKLNSTIQDLKSLFLQGGLVFGAQQFAMSIITTGGEMEKQHIALQSILGDMQNANTLFGQIKELALNSPFTFSELNRDVKQLAAYGVEYDQLYDTTKRLADMSSGLGVSFDRIALAFGQVQARGWLDGKELRQIAYAGIPLLDKLSDFYSKQEGRNVSTSEIKTRISNREVSFDDVKNIFWQMTDAGGQFYNMQQTLSETLLGRYNKLKDAWEIMLADFANGKSVVGGTFVFIINKMTDLVQLMHSFSPMLLGLFSGVAMKKIGAALAGSAASNFLSNKEKIAQDIKARAIVGQQLSQTEMRVLATKKQITREDLQALITAKAITKTELQRLYLSGKISKEMYKQAVTSAGMNNFWTNFSNKGGVAISLLGKGIASLGRSLWTMIGGWPGLILTAVTASIGYIYSEYQDLSQKIKQTQDELADRNSQILSFLKDNNVSVAITKGDDKEIDNMIDAYKEKLKQLAPYDYHNLVMTSDETKSHKDRLVYLEKELKLLKEANDVANSKMSNRSFYSDMSDDTEKAIEALNKRQEMQIAANKPGASVGEKQMYADEKAYGDYIEKLKDRIAKKFGDIAKDEKMRQAAMQSMSALFSSLGVPEDKADLLRASLLQAFGIGDKSNWLQTQVGDKMRSLIDSTFPLIGDKIKSNIPLTEAEKAKVKELMGDAKNGLIQQYPELERTLQGMLAASKFEAVIKLVVDGNSYNDVQSQLVGRIPNLGGGFVTQDLQSKYRKYAQSWGKEGSWYGARNKAKSDIDSAYNEYQSALKSKASNVDEKKTEWMTARDAAKKLLYFDYSGEGKKSNKPPKAPKGRQEDSELKALQERLSSLKSARQMYQKYSSIMSDKEAADKTYKLFPEVKDLDLKNYQVAVRKLLDGFKINTNDRKKFQTSVYREVAEWLFSEKDKKEFDKKAADFTEYIDRLSGQWDLYKSLLEKTGDKSFSKSAFLDNFIIDDKAGELIREYNRSFKKDFRLQNLMYLTDGEAKDKLTQGGEYDAWKKIVGLLRGNYADALNKTADIIKESLDYEEQIVAVREKYNKLIEDANKVGNNRAAVAARQQMEKEIGKINLDKFKNSSDYLNFYGAIVSLGRTKAQDIAKRIRENINDALQSGAIDAREYAKELKQLEEQLSKLSEIQPSFFHGGLSGIVSSKNNRGSDMFTQGSSMYNEAQRMFEAFQQKGDLGGMAQTSQAKAAGKNMMEGGQQLMEGAGEMQGTIAMIDAIIHGINDLVQGLNDTFQDVRETAEALGHDTSSDSWTDANSFFSGFSSASASATKGWDSLKNGDMGGVVSGVVGSFTGWIKAFSVGHDSKLDNQIKIAERQLKLLGNISDNVKSVLDNTLGGVYNYKMSDYTKNGLDQVTSDYERRKELISKLNNTETSNSVWKGVGIGSAVGGPAGTVAGAIIGGISAIFGSKRKKLKNEINKLPEYSDETYKQTQKALVSGEVYDAQLASLMAQREQLQKQRRDEESKKKSDKDKIADYDKQLEEMRVSIESFAKDFLKDIYSIDMKSWASELTDAVVGAWEKGEDAVDAYREKVKDMVKDVTKNIVTQKIMEVALQKPLDYLTGVLEEKGKLDETDMEKLAGLLYKVGDDAVPQITGIFDALKNKGWDLRENGSSSTTNSIKGITEDTADLFLLASYINSIRLDVSVNRENIKLIADSVANIPELNVIAQSQLTAMNQLVTLAEYRNSKLDDMYSWMRAITTGSGTKSIRIN